MRHPRKALVCVTTMTTHQLVVVACAAVCICALAQLPTAQAQALGYTTPDPPEKDADTGPTVAEEILNRAGVEGVEARLTEIMEGCDVTLYESLQFSIQEDYTFDDGVCFQVIDDLRRRQFGPPTDWEIFQVTCQGPCFSNYHRVKAVYEEAGCTCSQFEEYDAFLTLVEWERHVPTCLKYNTDHLCKRLQICKDPHHWYRHGCRGCGWEAEHEDQWREERDPDFGCGASAIGASAVLPLLAAAAVGVATCVFATAA